MILLDTHVLLWYLLGNPEEREEAVLLLNLGDPDDVY